MSQNTRCPQCGNRVLQKSQAGVQVRVRGRITLTDDGRCVTQCYWCKTPLEVPLELARHPEGIQRAQRFVIPGEG